MLKFITSLRNNAICSSTVRWKRQIQIFQFSALRLSPGIEIFNFQFFQLFRCVVLLSTRSAALQRKVNTPLQCQLCFTIFCLSKFRFDFPAALRFPRLPDFPRRCVRVAFSSPRRSIASLINDSFVFYCVTIPFNRLVLHHVYGTALGVRFIRVRRVLL